MREYPIFRRPEVMAQATAPCGIAFSEARRK